MPDAPPVSPIQLYGAAGFGTVIGWYIYYINRHRREDVTATDLVTLIGIIGGTAVLALFPAQSDPAPAAARAPTRSARPAPSSRPRVTRARPRSARPIRSAATTRGTQPASARSQTVCHQTCGGGACAHPVCATGVKLTPTCDTCAGEICAQDSFCCSNTWDSLCVSEVSSICQQSCN